MPVTATTGAHYQLEVKTIPVEPIPEAEPEPDVICGNCQKKIESKPVDPQATQFNCEHCGMTVKLA